MNSPQFAERNVAALVSRAAEGRSADEVVDELFLTLLTRYPTPAERELARDHLRAAPTPQAGYREVAWALLMSAEFSLNH